MAVELIPFDAADFLDSKEDIADYLTDMLADRNAALTQHALSVAVRAGKNQRLHRLSEKK